jgi:hypothetical protein
MKFKKPFNPNNRNNSPNNTRAMCGKKRVNDLLCTTSVPVFVSIKFFDFETLLLFSDPTCRRDGGAPGLTARHGADD